MVSIHAPARGATFARRKNGHRTTSFNPRARAGRDIVHLNLLAQKQISRQGRDPSQRGLKNSRISLL